MIISLVQNLIICGTVWPLVAKSPPFTSPVFHPQTRVVAGDENVSSFK